jgi:hypothetical protein
MSEIVQFYRGLRARMGIPEGDAGRKAHDLFAFAHLDLFAHRPEL